MTPTMKELEDEDGEDLNSVDGNEEDQLKSTIIGTLETNESSLHHRNRQRRERKDSLSSGNLGLDRLLLRFQ
jgi:hypothetical protein